MTWRQCKQALREIPKYPHLGEFFNILMKDLGVKINIIYYSDEKVELAHHSENIKNDLCVSVWQFRV